METFIKKKNKDVSLDFGASLEKVNRFLLYFSMYSGFGANVFLSTCLNFLIALRVGLWSVCSYYNEEPNQVCDG